MATTKSILDIIIRTIKQGGGDKETVKTMVDLKKTIGGAVAVFGSLAGAAYAVDQVLNQTADVFVEYAHQVERVMNLTGASAEESSKMIQAADDLGIEYETLAKSLQFMAKNGLEPTIEGLAMMADQYVALQPGAEQTAFLFDKMGKSGGDMAKLLKLGGDGLREWAEGVDGALVLTEESIRKTHEYDMALDAWNDSIQEAKVSLGSDFLPVMTSVLNAMNDQARANEIILEQGYKQRYVSNEIKEAAMAQAVAERERAEALREVSAEMEISGETAEEAAERYKSLLDITLSLQDGYDRFAEKEAEINQEIAATNQQFAEGSITLEQRDQKLKELTQSLDENASEMEMWSKRTVFSLVQARLAAEGGMNAQKFEFLINLGEQMGIIDEKTATMAQSVNSSLDDIDLSKPEDFYDMWRDIMSLPHNQVFTITTVTSGNSPTAYTPYGNFAVGGSYDGGKPMRVHQDEILVPNSGGYVLTRTEAMQIAAGQMGGGGGRQVTVYGGLTVIAQGSVMDVLEELS